MGKLIGIPEWVVMTLTIVAALSIWFAMAWRNTQRQIARTLARRQNITEREFVVMMQPEVSTEACEFLWRTASFYLAPKLTPHPEDNLLDDLPIDDDDWSMDWPRDFAKQRGFHESNLPDWPKDWQPTIRNYGRWLSMGPAY